MRAVDVGRRQIIVLLNAAIDDKGVVSAADRAVYWSQAGGEREWRRHIVELNIRVILEVSGLQSRLSRDPISISYRAAIDDHGPVGAGGRRSVYNCHGIFDS